MIKRTHRVSVRSFFVLYLIVWTISPFMEIDMIWRLLALGSAGLWFVLSLGSGIQFNQDSLKSGLFLAVVIAITFLETLSVRGILRQIPLIMLVIFYIMYNDYRETDSFSDLSWIVPVVLILLIVFNYRSGQAVSADPRIARLLVRDDEEIYRYLRQGIGGYSLLYPQVIIFPALLFWVIKAFRKNLILFAIGALWLLTYTRFLLAAGYSIAIVGTLLGLVVLFFYKGNNVAGVITITILAFVGAIAAVVYIAPLRNGLLVVFDGTAVAKKINDLMLSVKYGTGQGSIQDRIVAYRGSLRTIFGYPLIGGLFWASGGGHSAVLDMFAKYGLWGGLSYVKMIYAVPNYYRSAYGSTEIKSVFNATLSTMIFVSLLDSWPYAFMGMALIVSAIVFEDLLQWTGIKNEDSLDNQHHSGGAVSDPGTSD